ncbi:GNAT family N-acetyltransferase [Duffyella gerundensis]|uniref:GNAT family N-acetyltransferase n=1 Tax=Duffyella gerundensis TaxID=1619313 RepID=UPI0021F70349|nr:GNAT family N-acetyltransferase [Duffyella gerundensis]
MNIRPAQVNDSFALSALLSELGYGSTDDVMARRLSQLIADEKETLLVAEEGGTVLGFISLHFIPQLALAGDFARISYFCIAEGERSRGLGQQLLAYAEQIAVRHGCDRMEVHCNAHRHKANQFYLREGYEESPRYHIKPLHVGQ